MGVPAYRNPQKYLEAAIGLLLGFVISLLMDGLLAPNPDVAKVLPYDPVAHEPICRLK